MSFVRTRSTVLATNDQPSEEPTARRPRCPYAGLRPEEAIALSWRHVRERTLLVEQVVSMGRIEVRSKTRQARAVRLLEPVVRDLAAYRIRIGRPDERELLFPNRSGSPRSDTAQNNWRRRVFNEARRAAGIERGTPYYLRHSFASLLIWEGQPITYVAQQLGHSPMMTLRTYAHVIEEFEGAERVPAEMAIRRARKKLGGGGGVRPSGGGDVRATFAEGADEER